MINRFQKRNKAAEKWTEEEAILILSSILQRLGQNEHVDYREANPVRANSIKLRQEVCLLVGIKPRQLQYIKAKFAQERSRSFNEAISNLVQQIEDTLECRLVYSGTGMDISILKKHYGYL
jgi:hypothetical protein